MATYQQLLDQIDTCITNILAGSQSYTINGRTFTKANLKDLWTMRNHTVELLQQQTDSEGSVNGGRSLVRFRQEI